MARTYPRVRAVYADALRAFAEGRSDAPLTWATLVIAGMDDAESVTLVAQALRARLQQLGSGSDAPRGDGEGPGADLALSLASMAQRIKPVPEEVRRILGEAVVHDRPAQPAVQVYSLLALLGIDPSAARAAAVQVPGVPCSHGRPEWRAELAGARARIRNSGFDSANNRYFTSCCRLSAALEAQPRLTGRLASCYLITSL